MGRLVSLLVSTVRINPFNFVTARILLRAGGQHNSITLETDAHHLLTDVWTSVGVIFGVGLVYLTGWFWVDPSLRAGRSQHRLDWLSAYESFSCRSDGRIATHGRTQKIESLLAGYREQGLDFHALRTPGGRAFMTMHILVHGRWTVQYGHDWAERIENDIRTALPFIHITTHGTVGRSRVNERPNARHF